MKIDKHSCISAFIYYLMIPFVIFGLDWFGNLWWIRGGVVTLLLAMPVIILVFKEDKKALLQCLSCRSSWEVLLVLLDIF